MTDQSCAACRADLSTTGHNPACQNKPLEKSQLDRILKSRPGTPKKTETVNPETGRIEWEAYQVTAEENLRTILHSRYLTAVMEGLLRELAALVQIAEPGKAATSDNQTHYRDVHSPMPAFTSAAADKRIKDSERRLSTEVLLLSSATRNPHDPQEPQCVQCGKRATVVDSYCQPCGAAILKAHRRGS